jgi:hypothetical protein
VDYALGSFRPPAGPIRTGVVEADKLIRLAPASCAGLSPIISTDFEGPSLCILSISILLGVFLILLDEIGSCRKHHLGLLRFSVTKSRSRIVKLAVNSSEVDCILNALSELKFRFRSRRLQSFELMVEALDCLPSRCGRRRHSRERTRSCPAILSGTSPSTRALLAFLADGESWSSSALALASAAGARRDDGRRHWAVGGRVTNGVFSFEPIENGPITFAGLGGLNR